MTFNNYQLYRTTPKLSGNMKMDLVVDTVGGNLYIKDFHLRPISELVSYNVIDEDIMVRTHQLNIARFYSKTKADFYSAKANPQLTSDWPIILTRKELSDYNKGNMHVKTWDDTYWAGAQRMLYSLYNTTHEVMIPMWLEEVTDINKLSIEVRLAADEQSAPLITKVLKFNTEEKHHDYHRRFSEYLKNYFEHTGQNLGNDKCINVDLYRNETFIYGLNVEDGNMQTRTDFNITRNLLYRERPLLEANSLLTNAFNDVHLILPQLINLNICFNIDNWIPPQLRYMFTQSSCISVVVKMDGKELEKRDLFTNHQYVPRPFNEDIYDESQYYTDETKPFNALDYKHDYLCTDLMHSNKIVQPICHWALKLNQDVLFNLYDGFGAAFDGYVINHFFGTVNDISSTESDPLIPNTSPFGPRRLGDGDEVDYVINNAEHFTYEDPYFVALSDGWVNGFQMQYKPSEDAEIQEILIAGMTTPDDYSRWFHKTAETQTVTDMNYYAIWAERYGPDGSSNLKTEEELAQADPDSHDYKYDVCLYHDMDNRWNQVPGVEPDRSKPGWGELYPEHRLEINSYGLYLCTKVIPWPRAGEGKKALVVLIWDQQIKKTDDSEGLIFHDKLSYQNIGFIVEAIRKYTEFVKNSPLYKYDPNNAAILDFLGTVGLLNEHLQTASFPGVWYFNNTILERQNISVSQSAKEIIYKKSPSIDTYVYRIDGPIKPAMYVPAVSRVNGEYHYSKKFGTNYMWFKQLYKDNKRYNRYAQTGVPPCFPSLDYDSVITDDTYGECLLYDEVPQPVEQLKEHKWFDKSIIVQYPTYLETEVDTVSATDKEIVDRAVYDTMYSLLKEQVAQELWDEAYVKSLYEIKYELLKIKNVYVAGTEELPEHNSLLYTYRITMKLK